MRSKCNGELSGIVFLLLALGASVFIGKEMLFAVLAIIVLLAQLGIYTFQRNKRGNRFWVYAVALLTEILFLVTNEPWMFILAILLLIVAGVWNVFFAGEVRKSGKVLLVVRRVLYGIVAVIASVFWIVNIYAQPITRSVTLPADLNVEVNNDKLDSPTTMLKNIEIMNSFGSRTTGSEGHNQFIAWLQQQVTDMGLTVYRDEYTFDRWEEKTSSVIIDNQEIHVSSAFPYSGETDSNGVTGELVYTKPGEYEDAKGKIAVVEIKNLKNFPIALVMNLRNTFKAPDSIPSDEGDLVLTTGLKHAKLDEAKEQGVKAVIIVWDGVSDEKAEKQYLPFTEHYFGIPAVWVNKTEGKKVVNAAKEHKAGTVILEAEKQEHAPTESFYVKIEGKNKKESIIVNTHTDGVNVVEEDGAIGMLSMIRYLQQQEQPERTMIFTFVTGHFRLPEFKGTSQATSTWMQAHPELWDGTDGHLKAVAGLTVEHLGSLEWKDNAYGQYGPTGEISTEFAYAGNEIMEAIWKKAVEDRSNTRTVILRGHNKFQFGESQPLFNAGIPMIGLIPMPDYLLVDSADREMDKFDVNLMHEQVGSLLKALQLMDRTETTELGTADRYSFFLGRTK
ncbi:PA domain-containing protein [Paenibacillus sp. FSL H3-0469]|uniref:PA domain-containing protein n=1 Tax=Paenibacillus sp. FSL H3-0469 TaxID=2954506 RepID=UPI003100D3C2